MEEASYKKHGGFDGVQEARRQQLDAQAAARAKRKADETKKVRADLSNEAIQGVAAEVFKCCL